MVEKGVLCSINGSIQGATVQQDDYNNHKLNAKHFSHSIEFA